MAQKSRLQYLHIFTKATPLPLIFDTSARAELISVKYQTPAYHILADTPLITSFALITLTRSPAPNSNG